MESARDFAIRLTDPHFEVSTKDFDEYGGDFARAKEMRLRKIMEKAAMIEADRAAIRKECADRAMEAIGNIPPSKRAIWDVVETAIRAAIEGNTSD